MQRIMIMIAADMEELRNSMKRITEEREAVFLAEVAALKLKYKAYGKTEKSHLKRQAKEIIEMYFSRKCGETTPAQWDEFCEARKVLTALGCKDARWA
jgi:hypothetical protein